MAISNYWVDGYTEEGVFHELAQRAADQRASTTAWSVEHILRITEPRMTLAEAEKEEHPLDPQY